MNSGHKQVKLHGSFQKFITVMSWVSAHGHSTQCTGRLPCIKIEIGGPILWVWQQLIASNAHSSFSLRGITNAHHICRHLVLASSTQDGQTYVLIVHLRRLPRSVENATSSVAILLSKACYILSRDGRLLFSRNSW